ncbi:MAG TPA: hypothetical protein VI542_20960 [Candidatus Tectomicrobia bacterium]
MSSNILALREALKQKRSTYTASAVSVLEVTIGTGKGSLTRNANLVWTYYCLPDTIDPRKRLGACTNTLPTLLWHRLHA